MSRCSKYRLAVPSFPSFLNNAEGIGVEAYCEHWPVILDCCRETVQGLVSNGDLWYLDSHHGEEDLNEDALLQPTNE